MFRIKGMAMIIGVMIILVGFAAPLQASPPVQTGVGPSTDEENQPDDGQTDTGSSLGDMLDLSKQGYNLGTIMSGRTQFDDDGDEANDDTGDDEEDAEDEDGVDDDDPTGDDADDTGFHPVANAIAGFFGVSYDEVFELHLAGNGFGNIAKAYFFGDKIGMTPDELLTEAHGAGWGNVLKQHGIHPGAVGRGLGHQTEAAADSDLEPVKGPAAAGFSGPGGGHPHGNGPGIGNGRANKNQGGNDHQIDLNNGKAKGKDKDKGKGNGNGKKK